MVTMYGKGALHLLHGHGSTMAKDGQITIPNAMVPQLLALGWSTTPPTDPESLALQEAREEELQKPAHIGDLKKVEGDGPGAPQINPPAEPAEEGTDDPKTVTEGNVDPLALTLDPADVAEFQSMIADGLSEHEARELVWPDTPPSPAAPDQGEGPE